MGWFEWIVVMVAISAGAKVMIARYQTQQGGSPVSDREVARLHYEMSQLKDRIAVLERVITETDRSLELDREIERLRHNDRV